ncbi:MAG: porin family protein [Rhodoblastus sp.]|nr:porin family protein [Rhodoblastus sp.]
MRMVRILAAALAASTIAGGAIAADLPSRKMAPPAYVAPAPIFTWTGLYVGVNGGGWFNNSRVNVFPGISGKLGGGGGLIGGTLGYNWQTANRIVVGLETDLDYRTKTTVTPPFSVSSQTNDGYLGTLRGRVGYGFDRALIYVTGGLAYGNAAAPNAIVSLPLAAFAVRNGSPGLQAGWTVGAGAEFAVTNNWSIKGEYLYADLGSKGVTYTNAALVPFAVGEKSTDHIARAGVNYRFGFGGAPVYAKY